MRDSVFRTSTVIKENGKAHERIVDTIEDGDCYVLVLAWATMEGRMGAVPRKTVYIQKDHFSVLSDPSAPHELLLPYVIDIDAVEFDENGTVRETDWSDVNNVFIPTPRDEDIP